MAQPYVGEIRMFAGNFAPVGWHFCDGSLLPISDNEVLFQLIGTTYGGDGQETFGLPSLGGRVPVHQGTGSDGINYQMGETLGVESVTLTSQQIPTHTHALLGSTSPATGTNPNGLIFGTGAVTAYMFEADAEVQLNANSITPVGGSQPHENLQPYLAINYIISLFGIFPSQT
jgi:microcystin-dependent protein